MEDRACGIGCIRCPFACHAEQDEEINTAVAKYYVDFKLGPEPSTVRNVEWWSTRSAAIADGEYQKALNAELAIELEYTVDRDDLSERHR
jgi:hypothetical protein